VVNFATRNERGHLASILTIWKRQLIAMLFLNMSRNIPNNKRNCTQEEKDGFSSFNRVVNFATRNERGHLASILTIWKRQLIAMLFLIIHL
jgi:hypothetical protein